MLLVANQLKIKVLAVVVALALVMPMVMMPVGTVQAHDDNTNPLRAPILETELDGAEIEIIDGSPFIVLNKDECIYIPLNKLLKLSDTDTMDIMLYGVLATVEVKGNYLLIPTEDGIEKVCISDFHVELRDGQVVLVSEVNGVVLVVLGVVATAITIGYAIVNLADYLTMDEEQVTKVGQWIGKGHTMSIGSFNFNAPQSRDLNKVSVVINAYDVDSWEKVYVTLVGNKCGKVYRLRKPLPATGNDKWGTVRLDVCRTDLDTATRLFRDNFGQVTMRILSDPDGWVWIRNAALAIDH